ncbi:MAG: fluoride efflux transporter CrcB [Oceanospirillaceae bacterium]|nr:fluoride efflux transporter CrcB [Oceanospirillaceae bacterium]HCI02547.1 fluoride efflux transporter CrcB [Oceanospirillaceae bacterium]
MNTLIFIACGGAVGALLRYSLQVAIPAATGKLPVAMLLANVLGSLAMGILFVLIQEKTLLAEWLRPLLMVGLLGAFTTFSTFSLDTIRLLEAGQFTVAVTNILLSVVLSVGAAYIGITITRLLSQ